MSQAIEAGAARLADARIKLARLTELPETERPATPRDAYRMQEGVVARFLAHYGGHAIGYKIACTNKLAQDLLHTDSPFHGKMLSCSTRDSPGRLRAGDYFMRVMEAEFGFLMARDVPPRARPYERDEVADAVAGVLPGLEVVDSRFTDWTTIGFPSLIADNACHGAWVKGELLKDWRAIDLGEQKTQLIVNGKLNQEGRGSAVLGHPLHALTWLANALSESDAGLRAGEYVTTGVTTDIYLAQKGDRVEADFGPVGKVEVVFD
jgi:2-keto-4-pentenoate hydratase